MQKTVRNFKVQIGLSKQAQKNINRILEINNLTAVKEYSKLIGRMNKVASLPIRDATLRMAKTIEKAKVFKNIDLANSALANQRKVMNEAIESQKLITEKFKINHLQAIKSLVQNMNKIQSELSTIVNIPSLKLSPT